MHYIQEEVNLCLPVYALTCGFILSASLEKGERCTWTLSLALDHMNKSPLDSKPATNAPLGEKFKVDTSSEERTNFFRVFPLDVDNWQILFLVNKNKPSLSFFGC